MTTYEDILDRLHAAGYGVTINRWADDESYAVVLLRDSQPVSSGRSPILRSAILEAEAMLNQGRLL